MRPGPNAKRGRGRGNGRKPPSRNHSADGGGPSARVRGNAYQVLEKYLALARDATASGDRISAENYFQHAEHYYRVVNASNGGQNQNRQRQGPGPAERPAPPQSSQPSSQAQSARQSAMEQPSAEQPAADRPIVEQPIVKQPSVEQPSVERPSVDRPEVAQQAAGQPAVQPRPKAEPSRANGSDRREGQNGADADADEAETPDSDQPIV